MTICPSRVAHAPEGFTERSLQQSIKDATEALLDLQQADGHWVFELEADATIPAEYILLRHYLGEHIDHALEAKIAAYLRRRQGPHGGWPLFHGGGFDMSVSVKAYFALKMTGDPQEADHMRRARETILAHGGAAHSNVFTRALLALYGIVPWESVPIMPVEIMLLPRWFPFHLMKISYWARTVIVPLMVLQALKPKARNARGVTIDELFLEPPVRLGLPPKAPHQRGRWFVLFRAIDTLLRNGEPLFPARMRERAIAAAVAFVTERLNGEDGLGAIFPAMANTVMMFDALGYPKDRTDVKAARASLDKLLVIEAGEAYCQPCVSPVWDTVLASHALMEAGGAPALAAAGKGLAWLVPRQVLDVAGDWSVQRSDVRPGGWAFQYANPHYPDLDDTAVVVLAMDRARRSGMSSGGFDPAIARGREWVAGLQCRNGGWGAFDADNDLEYLNNIPFADHGALLDPPTADLTARCLSMLAQLRDEPKTSAAMRRALDFLYRDQRADGSWYGRWGINYIYGTWSALCALHAAGVPHDTPAIRKAAQWLISIQNADGGWGEDGTSYRLDYRGHETAQSTASQTAWALLGLMAAGEIGSSAVERGIAFLRKTQDANSLWTEDQFTATGFPRVFYLRYHGYPKYFPLWALARYRNLKAGKPCSIAPGM